MKTFYNMSKNFFYAVAILVGTIVGAGVFGIPYTIARFGFFPGIFYLFFFGNHYSCFKSLLWRGGVEN